MTDEELKRMSCKCGKPYHWCICDGGPRDKPITTGSTGNHRRPAGDSAKESRTP
jgi:hypothetical protein